MTESLISTHPTPSRAAHARCCALIIIVCIATFYPLAGHDYIEWDDPHNLFENTAYNPPSLRGLASHWVAPVAGLYVPVLYTVWYPLALIAQRTGDAGALDPRVFHIANIAAHVLSALAVCALLVALLRQLRPAHEATEINSRVLLPAAIGAALFAVHPVQVEPVAWISGFKDVLGGLFSVLTLWLYLKRHDAPPRRRVAMYFLATATLVLALLTKPVAVVVPVIAFVLEVFLLRRPLTGAVAALLPWLILAAPVVVVTRQVQPVHESRALAPPHVRPIIAGDALAFYLRQLIVPAELALDYGRSPDVIAGRARANRAAWFIALLPLVFLGVLWPLRRRARPVVAGAVVFVLALLPVLGLVPFSFQVYSTVADHYLYLPMVGVALAAAWGASLLPLRVALLVAIPILSVLAIHSWRQTWHWRDTVTLFTHNLTVNPRSWTSHVNLAAVALLEGDAKRAEHHARQARSLRPSDGLIYTNLGIALGMQGEYAEALQALQTAARLAPDDPSTRYWLAEAMVVLGRLDDAEAQYREALRRDPNHADAQRGLARLDARRRAPTAPPTTQ